MEKVEEMKKFLTGLDLTQDVLNSLFRQLDKSDQTLENWKRRSKEDWKDELQLMGNARGFSDIFNYLHPPSEGIEVLMARNYSKTWTKR